MELLTRRLPPTVRQHLRAARRERLLAVRALLDACIQKLEPQEAPSPEAPAGTPARRRQKPQES